MPSLHAADALIVGICLAGVVRNRIGKVLWLLWPIWVWFAVMATANHFWLDVVAGVAVAVLAFWLEPRISGRFARFRRRRTADAEPEAARIANLL
jgi:membrane-associated phospholipid phosphatase